MLELQYAKMLGRLSWQTAYGCVYGMSEYDNPFTDQRLQDTEFANVEMTNSNFDGLNSSRLAKRLRGGL